MSKIEAPLGELVRLAAERPGNDRSSVHLA